MSIKTLRKRISLVTATVLAAGTLSVVSMPVANAYIPALSLCTNINGVADVPSGAACTSSGVLNAVSGTGTTQTVTMLATGTLGLFSSTIADSDSQISFVVEGGTVSLSKYGASTTATSNSAAIASSGTYTLTATTAATPVAAPGTLLASHFKPNAGVSSMTVRMYVGPSVTAAVPTNGTLTGQIVVTVATASVAGVPSPVRTTVHFNNANDDAADATTDAASANYSKANGEIVYALVTLRDAYNNVAVPGGTLIFEVTGGAKLDANTSTSLVTTASTVTALDFVTAGESDGLYNVAIAQATANTAANFTLTVRHSSGIVLATKSGKITGEVATFTVTDTNIAGAGQTSEDAITVAFKDAAGNTVYPGATYGEAPVSGYVNAIVTDVTITEWPTATTAGQGDVVCGSVGGSTKMKMRLTTPGGANIDSNEFTINCAGEGWTYSASWDKASYTPGSIATLTITVKDDGGRLANDYHYLHGLTDNYTLAVTAPTTPATLLVQITGAPAATAVTAPGYGDVLEDGVKKYTFIVGSTEGDYNAIIAVPSINAANSKQSAVTAAYSIKVANAGVTNAEVLKSIVSLIASINKQIQALQKLILRR